ncbi:MAG: M23 family metallopeptidase [Oscillospiraceae bacterium]|nr:M23 family metallopeptidase [Oscillospiraceae bacterium]
MAKKTSKKTVQPCAEKKAKQTVTSSQFVESNTFLSQLKLLAVGCAPYVKDRTHAALYCLYSALHTIGMALSRIQIPRYVQMMTFLTASVVLTVYSAFNILYTTATTVTFDGVELATVASEEEAVAARMSVERSISDVVGYEYTLEDSKVSYNTGLTYRSAVENGEKLAEALNSQLDVVEHGYALYVDGTFVGATQTKGAFEELLDQVSSPYRNENTVSISFVEDVEIIECDMAVDQFTNLADVALLLSSTKEGEVTYTVEKGDCWSVIAQDHNMTNKELLALNPGYDIDKLQIGDVLVISTAVPYLTVLATQMEYYVADLPYEVEYVDDASMWEGDTKVISKGAYGTADIAARVTYQGAVELERVVESQTVLTEPVTEVQARGTKERPSWAPTGSFRWPTSGSLTSPYGYRYIFGSRSFHGGIDIANRKGTDIVAADGGIVTYAGWMSGYGYLIQIDHQNGYTTYYGHNTELLVGVGDKVHKGEHIAEMGSTGRSTGNHLHFEVRYKGERKDPMNYLP